MIEIVISAKSAALKFQGCTPDYVRDVCHGRCCRYIGDKTMPGGRRAMSIYTEPDQRKPLRERGAKIGSNGILIPEKDGLCTFQSKSGLCTLHEAHTPEGEPVKPRSCIISPWQLNSNRTLCIRFRYIHLRCWNTPDARPAYEVFRRGLDVLIGRDEAARAASHFAHGGGDFRTAISESRYKLLTHVNGVWSAVRQELAKGREG